MSKEEVKNLQKKHKNFVRNKIIIKPKKRKKDNSKKQFFGINFFFIYSMEKPYLSDWL